MLNTKFESVISKVDGDDDDEGQSSQGSCISIHTARRLDAFDSATLDIYTAY